MIYYLWDMNYILIRLKTTTRRISMKLVIKATTVTSETELSEATLREKTVIVIRGELYDKLLPELEKAKKGKFIKAVGALGLVTGAIAGGPIGWLVMAAGGASAIAGNSLDPNSLKQYKIEINESFEKVYLYKYRGKNKFNPKTMKFTEE